MAALSSANIKYTAEELAKVSGISAETMANWGLTQSTDSLTMSQLAELASSDAQAKKVLEKIIAQNAQKVANGEITASNIGLAASEGTATLATGSFTTAIKANISAMWTWMTTTPLGWLTLLVAGVFTAVKAYDLFTVSVDEQREAMEESISAYETARSELSSITNELESNEKAMSELLAKDKLTFAEKGQLEELKEINAELRIQKDLQEKNVDKEKKSSAVEAAKLYKKQFGDYDISSKKIDEYEQNADLMGNNAILISDEDDISSMLAGYRQFIELREQAFKDGDQYNIDHFTELTGDIRENLFETAQELQTQKDAMSDYYNALKDIPYDNLTSEQKEVVDAYNETSEAILLIYKELDRATWNELQFSKVTQEFSDTTQELQKLGKEGKVTAEMLNDPKYDAFIQKLIDIDFISDDTEGSLRFVASAFNGTMQSAQKYVTSLKGNEINNFIKNLNNEAKALGTTESELAKLTAAHVIFNNTGLSTEQQQQALQMLAAKIATTSAEMKYLLQLFNYASGNFDAAGASTMTEQERRARSVRSKQYLKDKYGIDLSPIKIPKKEDVTPYTPSGGDKGSSKDNTPDGGDKGSSKDNTPDYEDPTDAIINRINLRSKEIEKQEEEIQNLIEIAELENDYKKQISLTNDLIATRKKRVDELQSANNKLHAKAEELRNSTPQWNEEEWFDSQGNATEAYNSLYNSSSKVIQEKLKDQFERISKIKQAWVDNNDTIQDLTKENIKSIEDISDIASEALENHFDERNEISERWIQTQTDFDQLAIDGQIEAYARMVRNNREFLKEIEKNEHLSAEERDRLWKETSDKIVDYQLEAYNLVKKAIQQYGEEVEKGYDIRISRLNSESSLLSTHYDLVNAINEEQHNLNKELAEAEIAGAKMNELERQTLFTKEEHATLSAKLSKIMGDANSLQSDYLDDLKTATKDTIEEITNNYERQYELKMKEYEVVKAELALVKAQQKLENVENEKSVRTWNGTGWSYEAVYQDLVDAKLAVEDAKYAVIQAQTEQAQQNAINAINGNADSLETQKNLFAKTLEELSGETKITGQQLTNALKSIAETDLPTFEKIVKQFGDSLSDVFNIDVDSIRSSVGVTSSSGGKLGHLRYSSTIAQMSENSAKWASASSSEKVLLHSQNIDLANSIGASYDISSGTWRDKVGNRLYANGIKSTQAGLGIFDENGIGSEFVLTKDGILHNFNQGDMVFNPKMGKTLYELSQIDLDKFSLSDFSGLSYVNDSVRNNISNDTYYTVNGCNISSEEGGELKGFINFLKRKL